jgi:hypothetical protein
MLEGLRHDMKYGFRIAAENAILRLTLKVVGASHAQVSYVRKDRIEWVKRVNAEQQAEFEASLPPAPKLKRKPRKKAKDAARD